MCSCHAFIRRKGFWFLFLIQSFITYDAPHCLKHLFLVQSLPTIHTCYNSLEQINWFEAIFKMFCSAVFEAIEVKGRSRLNFEVATSKFCNYFWTFGCQPQKSKADLCHTAGLDTIFVQIYMDPLLGVPGVSKNSQKYATNKSVEFLR